jgi:threonine dehydrogenase-like Zn-dependent dehydrogenase
MVASGRLDPELLIERRVTLSEGAEALMAMNTGSQTGITLITDLTK